jgi:putative FmdB family regulatory protein
VPTYQYACTECGHRFEAVQSFHEDALTHCPECDGRLRKVFNAVGVVFKGSGFYRTDSRAASAEKSAGSSSEKSSGSSSEKSSASSDSSSSASPSGTSTSSGSGSSGSSSSSGSSGSSSSSSS